MAGYWDLMGEYDSETTSFTAFAGGGGASPYYPAASGRLKALRLVCNRSAAASLINHIAVKLTSTIFTPNAITIGAQGSGLQTAPAFQSGDDSKMDWQVDQPVEVGQKITMEGKNVTADTPVTVSALLYGYFETK